MKSEQYWQERAKRSDESVKLTEKEYAKKLSNDYKKALIEIENTINKYYARYGKNNSMSYEEVKKLLTPAELKSYAEQTKLYYDEVKALGLSDESAQAYLKELSAKSYMSRLEAMKVAIKHEIAKLAIKEERLLEETLVERYQQSYAENTYNIQQYQGYGDAFVEVDEQKAMRAIKEPWNDSNYSARVWHRAFSVAYALETLVPRAVILGKSSQQLAREIEDKTVVNHSGAMRLARTEIIHAANQAWFDTYNECDDVEKYKYLALFEYRTCDICGALDGKIFKLEDKQEGVNFPVMHPNCRCNTVPIFDDDDDDLEPTERIAYDNIDKKGKRLRYYVPADMSFEEWKKLHLKNTKGTREQKKNDGAESRKKAREKAKERAMQKSADSGIIKADEIRERLRSDEFIKQLNIGGQNKHIKSAKGYIEGRSYIYGDLKEAQELVNKYHGTGEIRLADSGNWINKEFITVDHDIGTYLNGATSECEETNTFAIHYGKKGTHIVPARRK